MESVHEVVAGIVQRLKSTPVPDDSLPDLIADLDHAEKILKAYRATLLAEAPGPLVGESFELKATNAATRSYNTSGLLAAFGGLSALPELVAADVVRINWQWSNLQKEANRRDVSLTVAKHEIEDGDPDALVGEVWKTRLVPQPKRGTT